MTRASGEYCTLCGKPATAVWHGDGTIAVCPDCAVTVLPALLADSVSIHAGTTSADQVKRTIERAEAVYWRAVALRLASEGRKGQA